MYESFVLLTGLRTRIQIEINRESVIESVYGLNQGLVDGIIEPDRWILELPGGNILSRVPAVKGQFE